MPVLVRGSVHGAGAAGSDRPGDAISARVAAVLRGVCAGGSRIRIELDRTERHSAAARLPDLRAGQCISEFGPAGATGEWGSQWLGKGEPGEVGREDSGCGGVDEGKAAGLATGVAANQRGA